MTSDVYRPMLCRCLSFCLAAFLVVVLSGSASGDTLPKTVKLDTVRGFWCRSPVYDTTRQRTLAALSPEDICPPEGACDDPFFRDSAAAGDSTSISYVRMVIHVVRTNDGSQTTSTEEMIHDYLDSVNQIYAPARIQFDYTINYIDSTYFFVVDTITKYVELKYYFSYPQRNYLNVLLVDSPLLQFAATDLPWTSHFYHPYGGIFIEGSLWRASGALVLAHEAGHALGLYHTFAHNTPVNGVACGSCYDSPGSTDSDYKGDLCSDTPPTPLEERCENANGLDSCSGLPWGYTMPENIMAYSPFSCYEYFTPQQYNRMRCWLHDYIRGWIDVINFSADRNFGSVPFDVTFTGVSRKPVSKWTWDFGDGTISHDPAPVHTYNTAGEFAVRASVDTPEGLFDTVYTSMIRVYADSVVLPDMLTSPGRRLRYDIYVRNDLTLNEMVLPISYQGEASLKLDSISTAGLRTSSMVMHNLGVNPASRTVAVELVAADTLPTSRLDPDSGAVLSMYFQVPSWVESAESEIVLADCFGQSLRFESPDTVYVPVLRNGRIAVDCCKGSTGNVDGDPLDAVDIGDATRLINYLFIDFIPPSCMSEADCKQDGDGTVDIGDLTRLIDFLFISYEPLPACP